MLWEASVHKMLRPKVCSKSYDSRKNPKLQITYFNRAIAFRFLKLLLDFIPHQYKKIKNCPVLSRPRSLHESTTVDTRVGHGIDS